MRSRALPGPLHGANEALAFLLELVMLAALAWWGVKTGTSLAARVLLGAGAPQPAVPQAVALSPAAARFL